MTGRSFVALSDPGGVRPVVARWTVTGELVLETATHFGGTVGDVADMVLIRDARTSLPLLPGTSIAGALRSYLADVLGGYRCREDERVACLFGAARGDDLGAQSPLIVFDSLGALPDQNAIEIRDGVQIDVARGIAEEHKKFDIEVLPAGTTFPVRFDLLVSHAGEEPELVALLVAALKGLSEGDIAFGARRSRGFGSAHARKWRAQRHDLSSHDGWLAWLLTDANQVERKPAGELDDLREACLRALGSRSLPDVHDHRRRVLVDAELTSAGSLLVRSAPTVPDAPDATHIRSAGRSILPGTSVAGVLRTQALRIARVVRFERGDAQKWIDAIFGLRMVGVAAEETREPCASKLRLTEGIINGGRRLRPSRVRIDRFTQGVVPGALFDEEPDHGGRVRLQLELRAPATGELGLLLLALKDLVTGEAAVGGTSSVGRGRFNGIATLRLEDGQCVDLDPTKRPDPVVEQALNEFWTAPVLGGGQ